MFDSVKWPVAKDGRRKMTPRRKYLVFGPWLGTKVR